MRVVVLGAGVSGVTLAYMLAKQGHTVEVIERQPEPAAECSFANGAQLSYSHAEPWANPGALKKAIQWLYQEDKPLVFRFRADWQMWRWVIHFLRNCTGPRARINTERTLRLGLYSRQMMHELVDESKIQFDYGQKGILHIFTKPWELPHAKEQAEFQVKLGAPYEYCTPQQCLEKEPALSHIVPRICGGIYYAADEYGDIHAFTQQLARKAKELGALFHFNHYVRRILIEKNSIKEIQTDKDSFRADVYVMALGAESGTLLRSVGIDVPIYPMKGYSISVPIMQSDKAPSMSVTAQVEKVVFTRIGKILRVAGTAEFAGYDYNISPRRIALLKQVTQETFPECGDIEGASEWACLRPQSPDAAGIIGGTRYSNLFLNTGHGTLGWTMAAGSARAVADLIAGKKPSIDLTGLTVDKYN